ncbi:sodium/proton antiporter 2 [Ziziphus jujuba]|uniref:Sodium/proton antiporter 2 n=1 Tax=Ziziphus jujuba TaxID=326968 RepID=A0A6P6GB15_ZIZJJ|nr:sodium/proton antiporter 2 [Ziziphus jujuba]
MVSLLRKLVPPSEYRKLLGAVVGIAANAGGAWTPIGDVTTTMRSIHGRISTLETMKNLAIPSAISLAVPLALMSLTRYFSLQYQKNTCATIPESSAFTRASSSITPLLATFTIRTLSSSWQKFPH